jgi:hypothetical protein
MHTQPWYIAYTAPSARPTKTRLEWLDESWLQPHPVVKMMATANVQAYQLVLLIPWVVHQQVGLVKAIKRFSHFRACWLGRVLLPGGW